MGSEMTESGGQAGPAFGAQERDDGIAQGGQGLCAMPGVELAGVFAQADIADVMDLVFNGPVVAPEAFAPEGHPEQGHLSGCQAGYGEWTWTVVSPVRRLVLRQVRRRTCCAPGQSR